MAIAEGYGGHLSMSVFSRLFGKLCTVVDFTELQLRAFHLLTSAASHDLKKTVSFYNGRNGKYNIHDPDSIYNICVYHIHVQYQDIRDNYKSTSCNLAVISGMIESIDRSRCNSSNHRLFGCGCPDYIKKKIHNIRK